MGFKNTAETDVPIAFLIPSNKDCLTQQNLSKPFVLQSEKISPVVSYHPAIPRP